MLVQYLHDTLKKVECVGSSCNLNLGSVKSQKDKVGTLLRVEQFFYILIMVVAAQLIMCPNSQSCPPVPWLHLFLEGLKMLKTYTQFALLKGNVCFSLV